MGGSTVLRFSCVCGGWDARAICIQCARIPRRWWQVGVVGREPKPPCKLRDDGRIAKFGVQAQLLVERSASAERVLQRATHLQLRRKSSKKSATRDDCVHGVRAGDGCVREAIGEALAALGRQMWQKHCPAMLRLLQLRLLLHSYRCQSCCQSRSRR
jgi:hypothetical protein